MASRDLNDLILEVKEKALKVIEICSNNGINILIYCTYRSLEEQARLYRQSRTINEILAKVQYYNLMGLDGLSKILMDVGPQKGELGKHVTNAGPGESWHNFKRAFDAVPLKAGKALWGNSDPSWIIYGSACKESGLEWAGNWKSFKEYPHAQLSISNTSNPISILKDGDLSI